MIVVELIGGLGNQLFQYAAGRALALKKGVGLKVNTLGFEKYKLHKYSLQHFNIQSSLISSIEAEQYKSSSFTEIVNLFARKTGLAFNLGNVFQERKFEYDPRFWRLPSNVYIRGFWQTECYFKEFEDQIRADLKIITEPSNQNRDMAERILSSSAISLHIRRGDYATDSLTQKIHGLCDLDYYEKAVRLIVEKQSDPHFFVFSDDPEWTRENLKIEYPTTFISHNDADTNFEDLRMMSICKHHIIANSSFSWWGAWLNHSREKVVVAPKRWFNDTSRNTKDVIPAEWIKI